MVYCRYVVGTCCASPYKQIYGNLITDPKNNIYIFNVPGAFEIPGTVRKILKNNIHPKKYNAIITLGSVIKGETAHFEYISSSVTDSISKLSIESDIPIIFGILTTYDFQQALERSDPNLKNKGGEFMQAAIDTIRLYKNQAKSSSTNFQYVDNSSYGDESCSRYFND